MRDNITKVAERGERLDQLQDKTGMSRFSSNYGGSNAVIAVLPCLREDFSHARTG